MSEIHPWFLGLVTKLMDNSLFGKHLYLTITTCFSTFIMHQGKNKIRITFVVLGKLLLGVCYLPVSDDDSCFGTSYDFIKSCHFCKMSEKCLICCVCIEMGIYCCCNCFPDDHAQHAHITRTMLVCVNTLMECPSAWCKNKTCP